VHRIAGGGGGGGEGGGGGGGGEEEEEEEEEKNVSIRRTYRGDTFTGFLGIVAGLLLQTCIQKVDVINSAYINLRIIRHHNLYY
jgi:hypothetical protein